MSEDWRERILDFRSLQTDANRAECCEYDIRNGRKVLRVRKAEDVVAVMLHQTACWYSVADYQLKAAHGDEELARHMRGLAVHAPQTAFRHGKIVIAHDPLTYVNHGHVANPWSIGQEHEGLYDVDGNPVRMPSCMKPADIGEIIEAGRAGLSLLVETVPTLRLVWAHRQSMRPGKGRAAKTSDPGKRIFREVGIEHGVKKLGLTIEPTRVFGIGRPLPLNWYQ